MKIAGRDVGQALDAAQRGDRLRVRSSMGMSRGTSIQRLGASCMPRGQAGSPISTRSSRSRQTPGAASPGVARGLEALGRADGLVVVKIRARRGLVGVVAQAAPLRAGVDLFMAWAGGLEQEAGAQRELGQRGTRTVVPDHGSENVVAGLQTGREIDCLIPPMVQVAARGTQLTRTPFEYSS